ncbi:MAG: tRNA (adenosine(37)-N6)-threonylcarbamoyltransferase complex dimerization subunit type 1 TsaB [Acidiferrobacterales bacterium]
MNLLAIDTSTEACTVALQVNGKRVEQVVLERQHAERLLGQVGELLARQKIGLSDIEALVWGRGPGMFTGLRIGAGIVQGLAYAMDCPVVCVSSLAALAQALNSENKKILTAIDARMGQVYWAAYQPGDAIVEEISGEQVSDPSMVGTGLDGKYIGAGSGWDQYHEQLSMSLGKHLERWIPGQYPSGDALLSLGEELYRQGKAVKAFEALPVYVRDEVAKKPVEQ